MRLQHLLAKRTADTPKDAVMPSHQFLVRGGYMRQLGQGLYTLLPLGQRIRSKIERIIREEMDGVGGQEISMPVVAPAELWKSSGRYDQVGGELVRFDDRTGHPHVLNMTHEEVVVDVVRSNVDSYRQLPLMVYQIQTKFRDEPRSRGGLVRVREFTMKDGYSFHRSEEDLSAYYGEVHEAYQRIFRRVGLEQFVDIESDVGMMGGSGAHEFMALSAHGEDTLLLCDGCGYRANREVATTPRAQDDTPAPALKKVHTPSQKTIEEVSAFLETTADKTAKAVLFMVRTAEDLAVEVDAGKAKPERPLVAFVRGDLEINQAKLRNAAGALELRPMRPEEIGPLGTVAGFVGPALNASARDGLGLPEGAGLGHEQLILLVDETVAKAGGGLVVGANEAEYHLTGFDLDRDGVEGQGKIVDIAEVRDGDPCPSCGEGLRMARGIEIGNIFKLGTKYSKAMGFEYQEEDGKPRNPIMGCYGIGVGRTLACVVEEHHDDRGPLWPIPVAPFEAQVCCLQIKKPGVLEAGERIYQSLLGERIETLLDDRKVGAGFMFADADLVSAPVRIVVSPRNLEAGEVELKYRLPKSAAEDPGLELPERAPIDEVASTVNSILARLAERY